MVINTKSVNRKVKIMIRILTSKDIESTLFESEADKRKHIAEIGYVEIHDNNLIYLKVNAMQKLNYETISTYFHITISEFYKVFTTVVINEITYHFYTSDMKKYISVFLENLYMMNFVIK